MNLKYFSLDEFDSPDLPNSGVNMDRDFLAMLDNARDIAQIPFKINSGYRTKERNEQAKGKMKSLTNPVLKNWNGFEVGSMRMA